MTKATTPSEMGKKSWKARVKKYGIKGAKTILKKASHKAKEGKKVIHSA